MNRYDSLTLSTGILFSYQLGNNTVITELLQLIPQKLNCEDLNRKY